MNEPREESEASDEPLPDSPLNDWADEFRDRLRNLIDREMDQRLRGRVDASDIVQDTFAAATRMLPDYLIKRPLPVYQWLIQIAINCLRDAHRKHILTAKQTVNSEQNVDEGNGALKATGAQFAETNIGPAGHAMAAENGEIVRSGLRKLQEEDQVILSLRYDSGLRVREIAAELNLSESVVKVRHFRAMQRLRIILKELQSDDQ